MGAPLNTRAMENKRRRRCAKTFLAWVLVAGFPHAFVHGLDFAPKFIETVVEGGFKNREVVLGDGGAQVVYCPPAGWQAESGGRWLRFHAPRVTLADLTIESEKAAAGRTFGAAEVENCRAWLKASIPRESSNVVMEADVANPGAVANCPTYGVTLAYTDGGVRYRKRVIFVFAPDSEIRFTLVARASDFERLYPAVRNSLFTWRWERAK
jgi:hypothetical protein